MRLCGDLLVQRSYLQGAWKAVFVSARDFLSSLKIVFESGIASYAGFEKNNVALLGFGNKFYLIFFFFLQRNTFLNLAHVGGNLDHLLKECRGGPCL